MKKTSVASAIALGMGIGMSNAGTDILRSATFSFFSPYGYQVNPAGNDTTLTGSIGAGTWSVSSTKKLFGAAWNAHDGTTFGPGTYTFDTIEGGVITGVVVGPGQVGGHILFDWNGNNNMDVINIWDVNSNSYTSTPVDSSAGNCESTFRGIIKPGARLMDGPFLGNCINFDLLLAGPGVAVSIDAAGGSTQECAQTGGSTMTLQAQIDLFGGTELGSIDWVVDGSSAGTGPSISPFMALGAHNVEVTATTKTGESDTAALVVTVRDSTSPTITATFLDRSGSPVTSVSSHQQLSVHFDVSDVCDPEPVATGSVVPVYGVEEGDVVVIRSGKVSEAELPASALQLTGTATDASGNSATDRETLLIEDK
jgi:hypothetical protein